MRNNLGFSMISSLLDVTSSAFYCAGDKVTIIAENVLLGGGDGSVNTMNVGRGWC